MHSNRINFGRDGIIVLPLIIILLLLASVSEAQDGECITSLDIRCLEGGGTVQLLPTEDGWNIEAGWAIALVTESTWIEFPYWEDDYGVMRTDNLDFLTFRTDSTPIGLEGSYQKSTKHRFVGGTLVVVETSVDVRVFRSYTGFGHTDWTEVTGTELERWLWMIETAWPE